MGSQVADPDARQNEEPAVVDDPVLQELPLLDAPTDRASRTSRWGAEAEKDRAPTTVWFTRA